MESNECLECKKKISSLRKTEQSFEAISEPLSEPTGIVGIPYKNSNLNKSSNEIPLPAVSSPN